jgi:hypothetical protein
VPQQDVRAMTAGEIATAFDRLTTAYLSVANILRPGARKALLADLKYYEKEFNRGKSRPVREAAQGTRPD